MIRDAQLLDDLLATIRRFVTERLVPLEEEVARTDAIPSHIAEEMKHLGLFGMTIPEEYGGLGVTAEEEVLIAMELGRTSPAFRSMIGTNNGIGSQGILINGTEEQRRHYLPRMAAGDVIGSFALTEPDAGSDAASLKTRAVRDGDGWILDGTKRFITNAPEAHVFTVMARTDPDSTGGSGVTAFLVPADSPGITIGAPEHKMGQQGSHVADVTFSDCRVGGDAVLGGPDAVGQGFSTAMKVLDRGRLHIGAVCVGVAERLITESVDHAKGREQFGKPIGEHQLVQAMLADSRTEAYAARSMVIDAARRRDDGEEITMLASCCKLYASEMVGRVADRAVQIHGGSGYIADYPVERFYRDVRLFRLYEGTSEIQRLIIARQMLRGATVT